MSIFTPRPLGHVPTFVRRLDSDEGRDISRLDLELSAADRLAFDNLDRDGRTIVTDERSGQRFLTFRAECGAGCRCAAEAVWMENA